MGHEAIKLELIEWLIKLEDEETIDYLKIVKDANVLHEDWWLSLTKEQKSKLEQGLKDVDKGRITPHDEVKRKYGL
jgi:hypothetical protein